MKKTIFHKFCCIVTTHQSDDLLPWWFFYHHLDVQFRLRIAIDDILDLVDFFAPRARKASLILMTLDVLVLCLEACMYDFWVSLMTLTSLIFLKYLEIWLTSFCDLVEIGGVIFSILTEIGLPMDLLLLLNTGSTLRVNFDEIFCLKVLEFLLEMKESYLD